MADISIKNLTKAFEEGKNILDGLSLEVFAGERVCLLGSNGAGKTTLLRLLTGELTEDGGDIIIAPGKRLGLVSQIPDFPPEYTAEDVLKTARARVYALAEELDALANIMEREPDHKLLERYGALSHEYERLGGYDTEFERGRVANGLDITPSMRSQLFSSLSGGEQTRVNLARLILEDTDILLLDEPTNHLDMKAARWLEDYLKRFRGTVLAISHDRWFLDAIATRTIELVGGRAELYSDNYSFYVTEKQRRYDEKLTKYEKEQKEIRRLTESAARLHAWGTGNQRLMKKSRAIESRAERLRTTDRPGREKTIRGKFSQREFFGDEVLLIEGLEKSFGEKKLFRIGELLITAGERVALIGENGAGKSTLLKIIMDELLPDAGLLRLGPSVRAAYLPQIVSFENDGLSVLDTVIREANVSAPSARNMLGGYKFYGDDVFKPVSALSGGEKSRLRLCILMKESINLLILDEPTNHLDIQSREWIEDTLGDYDRALLFVSHDRYFIDKFATRILSIENGVFEDFDGGFAEYLAFKEREERQGRTARNIADTSSGEKKSKGIKTNAAEKAVSQSKQLAKTERDIAALENKIAAVSALCEEFSSDYIKLIELETELRSLDGELTELYEKWESLT